MKNIFRKNTCFSSFNIFHLFIIHLKYSAVSDWLEAPSFDQNWKMRATGWYIGLENRLIDGIFVWKRGCIGKPRFQERRLAIYSRVN